MWTISEKNKCGVKDTIAYASKKEKQSELALMYTVYSNSCKH